MEREQLQIANIPRHLSASASQAAVLAAIFLVLAVVIRSLFFTRSSSRSQRHIVLAGPCGGGKTALFSQLVFGSDVHTCTSTKENEGVVVARWDQGSKTNDESWPPRDIALSRPLLLIDTPGLATLRARLLGRSIPQASGVVFVCDPVTGLTSTRIRETADALHLTLALIERTRKPIPLLILCTRADTIPAASKTATLTRAKAALEREMERRRAALASGGARGPTRLDALGAQAGSTGEAEDETEIVASSGTLEEAAAPWSFADVCPQATFALTGKGQSLDELWSWVDAR